MSLKEALDDRVVLVVGGSSGIGLATALAASHGGARVTITGRDETRLKQAAATTGGTIAAQTADVRDHEAMGEVVRGLGSIDHLVLAAGTSDGMGPVDALALDQVRAGLETKPLGYLATIRAALPVLSATGSITLVGAASARSAAPGAAGLALINGAVEALVPSLAAELAPIRVNAVSPGIIDTNWWAGFPAEARGAVFDGYASTARVRRVGRADDVAGAILSLMSNEFLTGTVLVCDGGATLG